MGKAINWPKEFYYEVIGEDTESAKIALRLGSLYYDNSYYCKGDVVDIRVDNAIVRKALITDDMKLMKIKELPNEILNMNKAVLRETTNVINFLSNRYEQPVNEDSIVTVITYKNLPKEKSDEVDDPHM